MEIMYITLRIKIGQSQYGRPRDPTRAPIIVTKVEGFNDVRSFLAAASSTAGVGGGVQPYWHAWIGS